MIIKQRIDRAAPFYLLIVLIFLSSSLHSQNDNSHKEFSTVICNYYLPSNLNGLSESAFLVTPRIRIDRYDVSANIILDIKKTQSTAADSNPSYTHSYNYDGKKYGNQNLGYEVFVPVRATNLTYEVIVTYGSKSWTKKVDGMSNIFGPIDKDASASEVNVYVKVVSLMFNGTSQIENKIRELTKPKEKETFNPVSSTSSNTNSSSGSNSTKPKTSSNQNTTKTTSPTYSPKKNEEPIVYSNKIEVAGKGNAQVYQQNGESYILYENGTKQKISTAYYNQTLTTLKENELITASNQRIAKGNEKIQRERDSIAKINESATFGNYVNPMGTSTKSSDTEIVLGAATTLLNQWAANSEAKQQREEQEEIARLLEADRKAEIAYNIKVEKKKLATNRKSLIANYPDGKTPLSSQAKDVSEVYFFVYSYNPAQIEQDSPQISISNVFPVAKFGDGTWPFKTGLIENISKTIKGAPLTLSGFYLSEEEAQQNRQYFASNANRNGFIVNTIQYAGKKSTTATNSNADFWGNTEQPPKKETPAASNEVDFWGNPSAPAAPATAKKAVPKPAAKKEVKATTKQVELDFWGNPVK